MVILVLLWVLSSTEYGWSDSYICAAHFNLQRNSKYHQQCIYWPITPLLCFLNIFLTACSKSADMPIDNSHCSSGMPSSLQTSFRQLASVWEFKNRVHVSHRQPLQISCITGYMLPWNSLELRSNQASQLSSSQKTQGSGSSIWHALLIPRILTDLLRILLQNKNKVLDLYACSETGQLYRHRSNFISLIH